MEPKKAAGLLIYRLYFNEIQYLLLKASYGKFHWTPPKGHVDEDEYDYETALRETKEEAGYTEKDFIVHHNLNQTLNYFVKGNPKKVVYWAAQLKDASNIPKLSDEHTDYKFVNLTDAISLAEHENFTNMIEYFDTEIKAIHGIVKGNEKLNLQS